MSETLNTIKDMYVRFEGTGSHLLLFWISLLGLILWTRKNNKKINYFLIIYSVVLMIIFVCPITAKIIMDYCIGSLVYWRMLWILPYVLIIAYVATNVIFDMRTKGKRGLALVSIVILIATTGTNIFSLKSIDPSTGAAKIPSHLEVICEEINRIADEYDVAQVNAVFPDELSPYVRQYDASIYMPYGRNVPKDMTHPIHDVLYAETLDYENLKQLFAEYNCNFLIINNDGANTKVSAFESQEFSLVSQIHNYNIYYYNVN